MPRNRMDSLATKMARIKNLSRFSRIKERERANDSEESTCSDAHAETFSLGFAETKRQLKSWKGIK